MILDFIDSFDTVDRHQALKTVLIRAAISLLLQAIYGHENIWTRTDGDSFTMKLILRRARLSLAGAQRHCSSISRSTRKALRFSERSLV
jgi:hypothetical protein